MTTPRKRLTPAQRRVLIKVRALGFVMIAGGFSGSTAGFDLGSLHFDRRSVIERMVAARLLKPGEYANQFVLREG